MDSGGNEELRDKTCDEDCGLDDQGYFRPIKRSGASGDCERHYDRELVDCINASMRTVPINRITASEESGVQKVGAASRRTMAMSRPRKA